MPPSHPSAFGYPPGGRRQTRKHLRLEASFVSPSATISAYMANGDRWGSSSGGPERSLCLPGKRGYYTVSSLIGKELLSQLLEYEVILGGTNSQ